MANFNAYICAADPEWLRPSVLSYYDYIDRLVVSFDATSRGHTGAPIPVEECLDILTALDRHKKILLLPGNYSRSLSPHENEHQQRMEALAAAGAGADWVLQIDTDEILTNPESILQSVSARATQGDMVLEFPAKVIFNYTASGDLIAVAETDGKRAKLENIPVAAHPLAVLTRARFGTPQLIFRMPVTPRQRLLELYRKLRGRTQPKFRSVDFKPPILHMSWLRSDAGIRRKLATWAHAHDFDTDRYLNEVWFPSRAGWKNMQNVHPIWPTLWPKLAALDWQKLGVTSHMQSQIRQELLRLRHRD